MYVNIKINEREMIPMGWESMADKADTPGQTPLTTSPQTLRAWGQGPRR